MIYQGKPCLPYFSSVVKNVANSNVEVKKLVYIYLLHYAESDPDLALLSVNAIQKSLTDQNPQVRAMALRTMSGMRVPVISQIVLLAIKRGVNDMSPVVRKAAALSIPKCHRLDPNSLPQLLEHLSTLLGDKQYFVVGPAVMAFLEICPKRIDLIHKHYRSLVKKLVDMDDWGQLATLKLLLHYSRRCFLRSTTTTTTSRRVKTAFYDDEQIENNKIEEETFAVDPDIELFLKSCKSLLHSRNSAVILSVTSCFLYLGTPSHLESAIGPLISLLRGPSAIHLAALYSIVSIALEHPALFVPYASHFFISSTDASSVWQLKIEMLTLIFPHSAKHLKFVILSDLEHFAHDTTSVELVREAVRAIGRCAQLDATTSNRCFSILLDQISSFDDVLVSEVLTVIRHLIQQDPSAHKKTIVCLARHLDTTSSPAARATIIWLVAEFAVNDPEISIAPDVLRILAKGFADESEQAKQQILLLAAKVYLHHLQGQSPQLAPSVTNGDVSLENTKEQQNDHSQQDQQIHPITILWRYVLLLTRYDTSYDLRDRARLFKALLDNPVDSTHQLAALLLFAPKPGPGTPSPSKARKGLRLGSTSLILGSGTTGSEVGLLPGYEDVPDWVKEGEEPDSSLRDTVEVSSSDAGTGEKVKMSASARLDEAVKERGLQSLVAGEVNRSKGKAKPSLDDWLEEGESENEESEDEATTSGEEEESGEDEGDDEDKDDDGYGDERRGLVG